MGVSFGIFLAVIIGLLTAVTSANSIVSGISRFETTYDKNSCKHGNWDDEKGVCNCNPEWGYNLLFGDCEKCRCRNALSCVFKHYGPFGGLNEYCTVCKKGFILKSNRCIVSCMETCGVDRENDIVQCETNAYCDDKPCGAECAEGNKCPIKCVCKKAKDDPQKDKYDAFDLLFNYNSKKCGLKREKCDEVFIGCTKTGGKCSSTGNGIVCDCPTNTEFSRNEQKCIVKREKCDNLFTQCTKTGGKCSSTGNGIVCDCPTSTEFSIDEQKCIVKREKCDELLTGCIRTGGKCSSTRNGIVCDCPTDSEFSKVEQKCIVKREKCDELFTGCTKTGGKCSSTGYGIVCDCPTNTEFSKVEKKCIVKREKCDELFAGCTRTGGKCSSTRTGIACDCPTNTEFSRNEQKCIVQEEKCDKIFIGCTKTGGKCSSTGTGIECNCPTNTEFSIDEQKCIVKEEKCDELFTGCTKTGGKCSSTGTGIECDCPANTQFSIDEQKCIDCKCLNGRCVTDNQGNTKCACKPGYALQDEFTCQPCDCGSLGKCIFILKLTGPKTSGQFEYQKKCVCDQGSAEKDGVCVDCFCGENSACDFDYGERRCYCIEGYSEKNGVCTRCDCGFYGKCEYRNNVKNCQCDDGYLELNGICTECDCGPQGTCSFVNGQKTCRCQPGFNVKNGRCETCNCGVNSVYCQFVNGLKQCQCKNNYADRYGTCEECACGAYSRSCNFNNNQKTCNCVEDYVQKGETCQLGCSAKNPCQNGGYCKGGFCFCQKGTRGEFCEVIDECATLCPVQGDIKCSYNVASQKAYCKCLDSNLRYNPTLRQCRRSCEQDGECLNGGKCGYKGSDKFCDCLPGTQGDRCEIIDDCASGRVKCPGNGAYCSFNVNTRKATCKCRDDARVGLEYDSLSGKCKVSCYGKKELCKNGGLCMTRGENTFCHCKTGTSGDLCDVVDDCQRGLCGFSAGVRCVYDMNKEGGVCQCTNPEHLYDASTKTCKPCDCGPNSLNCKLNNGKKVCSCRDGFEDKNGICRKTRCVEKSCQNGRCEVTANEQEVCSCYEGYELVGGSYCRRLNCTKTPCLYGTCIVRRNGREDCVCPAGHSLRNGACIRGACSIHTCFGGACRIIEGELMCVCPAGYSLQGIGCFATVCKHQPCYGGVCHVGDDGVEEICTCPDYHYLDGTVCKRILCQKPCFGGVCKRVNGTEVCECPSGYVLFDGVCRANFLQ